MLRSITDDACEQVMPSWLCWMKRHSAIIMWSAVGVGLFFLTAWALPARRSATTRQ